MKLPRPHPLRVAGHFASALPAASLTTAAKAEPAPASGISTVATSPPDQKDDDRLSAPVAVPAVVTVASATESIAMPRVMTPSTEQTTGSVTAVAKAMPVPLPRPAMLASLAPVEQRETGPDHSLPLPRARPPHEARHTPKAEKQADRTEKKSGRKSEKKTGKHADRKKRRA
jgi:hypothetical protein